MRDVGRSMHSIGSIHDSTMYRTWSRKYIDIRYLRMMNDNHLNMPVNPGLALWQQQQRIIRYAALIISIVMVTTANILQSFVTEVYFWLSRGLTRYDAFNGKQV
jgi:hypothetical protein